MVLDECVTDFDCPGTELCYKDLSWLDNNTVSLCDCSSWWGFTGAQCTAAGPTTLYLIVSAAVIGCLAAFLLVFNGIILYNIITLGHTKKWNSNNATLLFTTLGCLGVLLWRIITIIMAFTPEKATLNLITLEDERLHILVPIEKITLGMSVLFGTLSAITVVIAWVDIVNKSRQLMASSSTGAFATFVKPVIAFGAAFVVCVAVSSILGKMEIAVIASTPFFICMIVAYIYAYFRMGSLVGMMERLSVPSDDKSSSHDTRDEPSQSFSSKGNTSPNQNRGSVKVIRKMTAVAGSFTGLGSKTKKNSKQRSRYIAMLNKVRRTSVQVILSIFALMVCGNLYAIPVYLFSWRELCQPGDFCMYTAFIEFTALWILALIGAIQLFIYENFANQFSRIKRARSKSDFGSSQAARSSVVPPSPAPVVVHMSEPHVSPLDTGDSDGATSL